MKKFRWNKEKNERLKIQRGISFEEITSAIAEGGLTEILEHPNKKRYQNQKLFVVRYAEYVYLVPFVESESEIFLKTIIPSRKFTKRHRRFNEE